MVFLDAFEALAQQPSQLDPKGEIVASVPSLRADRVNACMEEDIQNLSLDSDFRRFMRADCSPGVRLKALRQLWRLLPWPTIDLDSAI